MNCCTAINADTARLFSRFAGLHRLRFRIFGLEKTQRQLIEGVRGAGLEGAELLEVGCGPGYLHRALLRLGAARATGVDLSECMLSTARAEARASGLQGRVDYRQGDFVRIADEVGEADVTLLDKVICCYPDWEALVDRSLAKTRRVYALTYPRDRLLTRLGVRSMRWGLRLAGCCYQPYLHDPRRVEACILGHGFVKSYSAQTSSWLTQVYTRPAR
jgi:magnesium-protoporphyrin O-methyltransferase